MYKTTINLPESKIEKHCRIRVNVVIDEPGELHITGDIYEKGRDVGGGQCYDELARLYPDNDQAQRIVEVWKRWHLNHLKAGDAHQERYLRNVGRGDGYDETCSILEKAGILEHNGYKYGTKWLKEELPPEVIAEVKSWANESV